MSLWMPLRGVSAKPRDGTGRGDGHDMVFVSPMEKEGTINENRPQLVIMYMLVLMSGADLVIDVGPFKRDFNAGIYYSIRCA